MIALLSALALTLSNTASAALYDNPLPEVSSSDIQSTSLNLYGAQQSPIYIVKNNQINPDIAQLSVSVLPSPVKFDFQLDNWELKRSDKDRERSEFFPFFGRFIGGFVSDTDPVQARVLGYEAKLYFLYGGSFNGAKPAGLYLGNIRVGLEAFTVASEAGYVANL
jgi:hypothetical protein